MVKARNGPFLPAKLGCFIGPESGVHHYIVPPMWSSDLLHPFCLIGDGLGVAINAMDLSIVPPRQLSYLNLNSSRSWVPMQTSALIQHLHLSLGRVIWSSFRTIINIVQFSIGLFDSSKGSSVCHDVLGFNKDLAGAFAVENMAWQPTIKSAPIYALAEKRQNGALHLIDAQNAPPSDHMDL